MAERDLQRAVFKSEHFLAIATDPTGVIQAFGPGCELMLGYRAADVVDRITPADLSDPQGLKARAESLSVEFGTPIAPGFEALVYRAARGVEDVYALSCRRKDASSLDAVVAVTAVRDTQDAILGYLIVGTQTFASMEPTRIEQRLNDRHRLARALIESNVDALLVVDPRGLITDLNEQAVALTGFSRAELTGATFSERFTDAARAEAAIARTLNEGAIDNCELTARARDGSLAVLSCDLRIVADGDRHMGGVLVAARDITELKRAEHALQLRNDELDSVDRLKAEFLAQMSHELRSALSPVIGFAELLRDGMIGPISDKQRGFIDDIHDSGAHLLSLIDDILDLSKVEAGEMTLHLAPVNLSSLLANSLSIVKEKALARRICLNLDVDDDPGSLLADKRKVKQIVYNLLANAVKFAPDGGSVVVTARRVPRAEVGQRSRDWAGRGFALADSEFSEFLAISVLDNGIGISPEGMAELFTPFTQVNNELGRAAEGTGLGLAMVKGLAELHGGTAAVESAIGVGSLFSVWLPCRVVAGDSPVP